MKYLKIIGYSIIIIVLVNILPKISSADTCNISNVEFTEVDHFNSLDTTLSINTSGCEDGISIRLMEIAEIGISEISIVDDLPLNFYPNDDGLIAIILETDEGSCYADNVGGTPAWGVTCITYIEIYFEDNLIYSGNNPVLEPSNIESRNTHGVLIGNCPDQNGQGIGNCYWGNWEYEGMVENSGTASEENADQTGSGSCTLHTSNIRFSNMPTRIIHDTHRPIFWIDTSSCQNTPIEIKLWSVGSLGIDFPIEYDVGNSTTDKITLTPISNTLKIFFNATDYGCVALGNPDCEIYYEIKPIGGDSITNEDDITSERISYETNESYSGYLSKGIIFAECETTLWIDGCSVSSENWKILDILGAESNLYDEAQETNTTTPINDPNSPCFDNENCYEFLAPIPGLGDDVHNNGRFGITDLKNFQFGEYVNSLFQVALGILMVLAVIMIVLAGVEYMTVESIYGKSKAKSHITGALTGLILALGIFLIIKTINPKLLEINFGKNIITVTTTGGPALHGPNGTVLLPASGGGTSAWTLNGDLVHWGDDWSDLKDANNWIDGRPWAEANGFKINKPECGEVGDTCTSMYFEESVWNTLVEKLQQLKNECPDCADSTTNTGGGQWIITGGSEAWLHSTHGPDKVVLDMVAVNPSLNEYFGGNQSFIGGCVNSAGEPINGSSYIQKVMPEDSSCPGWNPAPHWHIWFDI